VTAGLTSPNPNMPTPAPCRLIIDIGEMIEWVAAEAENFTYWQQKLKI
jgi:hypothetical protein